MNKKNQNKPIEVAFTLAQRDLILGKNQVGIPIDPLIDDVFRVGLIQGKSVVVKMTLSDIDDLIGFVAFEANHTKDWRLAAQFDKLYSYLDNILRIHS
jgi:hypothetical protein